MVGSWSWTNCGTTENELRNARDSWVVPLIGALLKNFLQNLNADRLREVFVETGRGCLFLVFHLPESGERDEHDFVAELLPNPPGELVAIDPRHADVDDGDIGTCGDNALQSRLSIRGSFDCVAKSTKLDLQQVAN